MSDTQLDIIEIKQTIKKMQTDIDELARMIAEQEYNCKARYDRISCTNLAPSTQACDVVYDVCDRE